MSVFLIIFFFFFNDTATTEIYTLSLHDALPISVVEQAGRDAGQDLDLLGLLEEEVGAGATQRVVRDLDLGVVAGGGHQLAQQLSRVPALPAAGGEMTFHGNLCRLLN